MAKKGDKLFSRDWSKLFFQNIGKINWYEGRDQAYIEEGYQKNPTVYSIVSQITQNAGKVKWYLTDMQGNKLKRIPPSLNKLLRMPNDRQTWSAFVQEAINFRLLTGNSFVWREVRGGNEIGAGQPKYLHNIPANNVEITLNDKGTGISYYSLDFTYVERGEIPASEVLHMRDPNPDYDADGYFLYGQSPLEAASRSLRINNECLVTAGAYLKNQGPKGVIYNKNQEEELGTESLNALQKFFRRAFKGSDNAGDTAIIDGELGYIQTGSSAADVQLLEQYNSTIRDICNAYNFPCSLLGLEDSTYQNAKEAKKALWENCVKHQLCELRDGLNAWLLSEFGSYEIQFDLSDIDAIQEDKLMRGKAVKEFAGMVTVNEAREMAGLKPVDKLGEFNGEDMYVGFTQAVVTDSEDISDVNDKPAEDAGA